MAKERKDNEKNLKSTEGNLTFPEYNDREALETEEQTTNRESKK